MIYLRKIFESYYNDEVDFRENLHRFCNHHDIEMRGNHRNSTGNDFLYWYTNDSDVTVIVKGVSRGDINYLIDSLLHLEDFVLGDKYYKINTHNNSLVSGLQKIRFICTVTPVWKKIMEDYSNTDERGKALLVEEMSKLDPNQFIEKIFEWYCRASSLVINFEVLKAFKDSHPIIETPIYLQRVRLHHNYSRNLAYDMAPLFLNELSNDAGILCKFGAYDKDSLTRERHDSSEKNSLEEIKDIVDSHGSRYTIEDVVMFGREWW